MIRIGIDGLGRIGSHVLRRIFEVFPPGEFEIAGIQVYDSAKAIPARAFLLEHDPHYGVWSGHRVGYAEEGFVIDCRFIPVFLYENFHGQWGDIGIDILFECAKGFKNAEELSRRAHGAPKILVSNPLSGADAFFVYGVNHESYDPDRHRVVSNSSCTTNAAATILYPLCGEFGALKCSAVTIHAATESQEVMRTIGQIFPHKTGAAHAVAKVICELEKSFEIRAFRVPTASVSVLDLTCVFLSARPDVSDIRRVFERAAEESHADTLKIVAIPLGWDIESSGCYARDSHVAIVNLESIRPSVFSESAFNICAYYDNEWGYACNLVRMGKYMLIREEKWKAFGTELQNSRDDTADDGGPFDEAYEDAYEDARRARSHRMDD